MEFPNIILRALQFLFTLLTTALIGNVIQDAVFGNPSAINYAIFTDAWCWLVLLVVVVAFFVESVAHPLITMIMDGLAALFTFVAGVVLAAKLGAHSCSNFDYTATNSLTNGEANTEKRCRELQASTAFFWFLWACFMGSLAFGFMARNHTSTGTRRTPNMAQV